MSIQLERVKAASPRSSAYFTALDALTCNQNFCFQRSFDIAQHVLDGTLYPGYPELQKPASRYMATLSQFEATFAPAHLPALTEAHDKVIRAFNSVFDRAERHNPQATPYIFPNELEIFRSAYKEERQKLVTQKQRDEWDRMAKELDPELILLIPRLALAKLFQTPDADAGELTSLRKEYDKLPSEIEKTDLLEKLRDGYAPIQETPLYTEIIKKGYEMYQKDRTAFTNLIWQTLHPPHC